MSAKVAPANPKACAACPWRIANQGMRHPDGWYTAANLKRLWAALRQGGNMSCHPTDSRNPVPEGTKQVPESVTTHECAGALTLQQREMMNFQDIAQAMPEKGNAHRAYLKVHPNGMTKIGLAHIASRAIFGNLDGVAMTALNLNDPDVGYARLAWKMRKAE